MYRGFEININNWNIDNFHELGLKVFDHYSNQVVKTLDEYFKGNKALDANEMRKDWFPVVDCDVFISHSHTDKDLAVSLAGWLFKTFKIKAFIDSMIWGYADDLLRDIDDQYCKNTETGNYYYKQRNYSTSHIHIMLTASLNKMIDNCECFFFIKTDNSITTEKAIRQAGTYSPWIYSEIETSRIIRRRPLEKHRKIKKQQLNERLQIEHPLHLDHLEVITEDNFLMWKDQYDKFLMSGDKTKSPLDILYLYHVKQ